MNANLHSPLISAALLVSALIFSGNSLAAPLLEEADIEADAVEAVEAVEAMPTTQASDPTEIGDELAAALEAAEANASYVEVLKQQLQVAQESAARQDEVIKQFADTSKAYAASERRLDEMKVFLQQEKDFIGRLQQQLETLERQSAAKEQAKDQEIQKLTADNESLDQQLVSQKTAADEQSEQQANTQRQLQSRLDQLTAQLDQVHKNQVLQVLRLPNERTRIRLESDPVFLPDRVRISPQGQALLIEVAQLIQASNTRLVRISVHTDRYSPVPPGFRNQFDLTRKQANIIIAQLRATSGLNHRFSPIGAGDSDPIASHETAQGQTMNRRIEFLLDPS